MDWCRGIKLETRCGADTCYASTSFETDNVEKAYTCLVYAVKQAHRDAYFRPLINRVNILVVATIESGNTFLNLKYEEKGSIERDKISSGVSLRTRFCYPWIPKIEVSTSFQDLNRVEIEAYSINVPRNENECRISVNARFSVGQGIDVARIIDALDKIAERAIMLMDEMNKTTSLIARGLPRDFVDINAINHQVSAKAQSSDPVHVVDAAFMASLHSLNVTKASLSDFAAGYPFVMALLTVGGAYRLGHHIVVVRQSRWQLIPTVSVLVNEELKVGETGNELITTSFWSKADVTTWSRFEDPVTGEPFILETTFTEENRYSVDDGASVSRVSLLIGLYQQRFTRNIVKSMITGATPFVVDYNGNVRFFDYAVLVAAPFVLRDVLKRGGVTFLSEISNPFRQRLAELAKAVAEKATLNAFSLLSNTHNVE